MNPKTQTTMTAESLTSLFEDAIRNKVWITGPGALTNCQDAAKKCAEIHKNELNSKTEALQAECDSKIESANETLNSLQKENEKLQKDIGEWKLLHRQKCDQVQNCENAYMRLEERNITLQSSADQMEKALASFPYEYLNVDYVTVIKNALASYRKLKTKE